MTNATKHFLTIDNGGTNTKVIIVDQDGRQLPLSICKCNILVLG